MLAAIVTINTPVARRHHFDMELGGTLPLHCVQIMSLKERDFIQICTVMHE
ncbi:MAG: hypothetical protein ACLRSW_03570 [Christensenellaceae bacterium]